MRKALVGIAVAALATVGMSGTAQAVPDKNVEEWVCDGVDTVLFTAGRNGWVDGEVQYHAVHLNFTATFTPADGSAPQTEIEDKTWANGRGLDDPNAVTCTTHFEETSPDGTFVGDGEVVAVPVHK